MTSVPEIGHFLPGKLEARPDYLERPTSLVDVMPAWL